MAFVKFNGKSLDRWMETERGEEHSRGGSKKQHVFVKVRESIREETRERHRFNARERPASTKTPRQTGCDRRSYCVVTRVTKKTFISMSIIIL